jgi:hypothetical protein
MKEHKRINKLLVGYLLGELSPEQITVVQNHLVNCPRCSSEFKRLEALLECTGQIRKCGVDEKMCESAKQAIFQTVENQKTKQQTSRPYISLEYLRKTIMKSTIAKFYAAAVVVITALIIYSQFNTSGVAWGALVEKIDGIKNVVYDLKTTVNVQDPPQGQTSITKAKTYYSSEYGSRVEQYVNNNLDLLMYLNPEENLYVTVIPKAKTYLKVTNKSQKEIQQISDKDDPRVMVRQMMSMEYKKLGRNKINGINVEGIECTGQTLIGGIFEKAIARLWVEIGTDYPVRLEIDGTASGGQTQMSMVMDNFQWNVDLAPALFIPDIPADYTRQETIIPETNEGTVINALRFYAELTDGLYPSNLAITTLRKEGSEAIMKKYGKEIIEKQEAYSSTLQSILSAGAFYTQLNAISKDVAYYGDQVTADSPELVLMRWKVKDGVYHVIFADLSAGDFTSQELAELEAALPK